ncbi:hypothetical protein M5K25_023276 [Dendrobium thyrsiflorum]|uniref:Pectinesterase n=1 Tax=Dendrobium thyrsiflorum TaxID=117978 RepID=A0ABD0UEG7_DENTH
MRLNGTYFTLITAMIVALLSLKSHLFCPMNTTLMMPSSISSSKGYLSHHHHNNISKVNVCDDFARNILPPATNISSTLCVDRNGCCNFTSVQSAINVVSDSSQMRTIIWINKGIYFASLSVFGDNFIAKNISFMNVAPIAKPGDKGAQAVAIRVAGDQAAFWGCGFFGAQDTLHDDSGRHYFKECYIQGSIDFIFGDARSLYENCQLISMASPVPAGFKVINGAVTAHGRVSKDENTGFSFVNCSIGGTGRILLGRAWRPFSRVIFAFTSMTDIISPEGWNDFNDPLRDLTVFYGEYKCSGAGANQSLRAPYVLKLNDTQAASFLNSSYVDGDQWLQPYS